jgi:hypothetical protein
MEKILGHINREAKVSSDELIPELIVRESTALPANL